MSQDRQSPAATAGFVIAQEARQLAALALPVIMTQLAQRAIGTTDVMMLGAYDPEALDGDGRVAL